LDDLHALNNENVEADQRYSFTFDGAPLQLDLTSENATEFERVLRPYLDAATPVQKAATATITPKSKISSTRPAGTGARKISKATAAQIRQWALDNGMVLKQQGPLPRDVKEKYAAAQGISVDELH
jgi:hypothetical protein